MNSYTVLRLVSISYKEAIADLSSEEGFRELNYAEQFQKIVSSGSCYADSFSKGMKAQGVNAVDIFYDIPFLQNKWLLEFDGSSKQYSSVEIILKQIAFYKPDVLYLQDIQSLPEEVRKGLKLKFKFLKKIVLYKCFPGNFFELGGIDIMLAGTPLLVKMFSEFGLKPHLVYHYFDMDILSKLSQKEKAHNITFAGSSGFGYRFTHQSRYFLLKQILTEIDINCNLFEPESGGVDLSNRDKIRFLATDLIRLLPRPLLKKLIGISKSGKLYNVLVDSLIDKNRKAPRGSIPQVPLKSLFPSKIQEPVFGMEMYSLIQKSRVILNTHTNAVFGDVGNMRMFETTGIGTCMLVDHGNNIDDLFEPDHEVVTFKSNAEAIEKIHYLQKNPKKCEEIAKAGQKRCLKNHTNIVRCEQIHEIISKELKK